MKKIFFAFSLLAFILTSCSENNDTPKQTVEPPKVDLEKTIDGEEVNFEKTATEIVYALAVYLYKDGKHEAIQAKKNEQEEKFKNYEKKDTENIINIANLFDEKSLSKDIIQRNNDLIKTSISKKDIDNLVQDIIKELEERQDYRKPDAPKGERSNLWGDFKKEIEDIKSVIEEKTKKPIIELKLTQEEIGELQTKLSDGTFTKPAIPSWLYAIPVILFVLLAAAIYFIKMIYDSLEKLKIKRDSDKQKFNDLKYNHDRLNNKVAVINLDAVRDEMYEQMNILARRINDTQSEQVRDVRSTPQAKPEPKIFYAQYPDSADPVGFKNIQFESNSKMVYRITRIEGNKARFIIQPDENTQQYAIGNHGKILKPVCEYLNQPSSMNRTIKVFREGRLEMQNNIWIVVEKLKIKFE